MSTRSLPQTRFRRWQAVTLNGLAKRTLAITMRANRAGLLGPTATYVGLSIASRLSHVALHLLRLRSVENRPAHSITLDPQSQRVVVRFLLKLAVISFAALLLSGAPWGRRIAITAIVMFSALTSSGLAILRQERPFSGSLNYWDETVWFLAIGAAAQRFL